MNEQIKRRLKELEIKHPSISDFCILHVTMTNGEKRDMLLSDFVKLDNHRIERVESENPDLKALALALLGIDTNL